MTKKKTKRGAKMTTRKAELQQTVEYDLGTITRALLIAAADPMNDLQLIRRAMLTVLDQCDQTKKMIDADLNRHLDVIRGYEKKCPDCNGTGREVKP